MFSFKQNGPAKDDGSGWCDSDEEPLKHKLQQVSDDRSTPEQCDNSWCPSDEEPLKKQSATQDTADWSTSDFEPLINVKCVEVSMNESEACNDDANDPTYYPSTTLLQKAEISSSDSEEENNEHKRLRSGRKRLHKPSNCNGNDLNRAKVLSLAQHKISQSNLEAHKSRLQNFLAANAMYSVDVPADGNCFFEAASMHLHVSSLSLRQDICDFMDQNVADYIVFFFTKR